MEKEKMEPLNWWSQYVLSDVSYLISFGFLFSDLGMSVWRWHLLNLLSFKIKPTLSYFPSMSNLYWFLELQVSEYVP